MELNSKKFHIFVVMILRTAHKRLVFLARKFKAVAVTGPRQSGKTTLVRKVFPRLPYLNLENPDTRRFASEDPRGFLSSYPSGAILDEAQRVPELFSYLQEILDARKKTGRYILTGSNHFLLQENISQTLAGRIGYLQLLPFTSHELFESKKLPASDDVLMLKGFYPPVYAQRIPPTDWYANYIRTYVERDVRQLKNIGNLYAFERFLRLLAGRHAQELNYSALAVEAGLDVKTIQAWVGLLESSFVVFLLKPYYRNFNKSLIKRPKIYFYDSGLVCYLLGIQNKNHLRTHPLRGSIFEGMVIADIIKHIAHKGLYANSFFWRDKTGHEVDLILEMYGKTMAVEVKSAQTFQDPFLNSLKYWKKLDGKSMGYVLFGGHQSFKRTDQIQVMNWKANETLIKK
ncbi:MAG: ATP-binding protein [Bacteroidia bacterium]|nr:ATP-binding protein [Bacteroidia bacterium]